jgi:hypothetical protein
MSRQPFSTRPAQNAVERAFGEGTKLAIDDGYAYIKKPGAEVVERFRVSDETLRMLARIDEGYEVGSEGLTLHFEAPDASE